MKNSNFNQLIQNINIKQIGNNDYNSQAFTISAFY